METGRMNTCPYYRAKRCIVDVAVVWERRADALQTRLDPRVWTAEYFRAAFNLTVSGVDAGTHQAVGAR